MNPRLFTALAIAASVISVPAAAQTGENLIQTLLNIVDRELSNQGLRITAVANLGNGLDDGESRGDIVRLDAGRSYIVVGVCDEDCEDFDLEIKDRNGEVVGSDFLEDDAPMVRLNSVGGGGYQIRSIMADCSLEPCLTGVRVYRID